MTVVQPQNQQSVRRTDMKIDGKIAFRLVVFEDALGEIGPMSVSVNFVAGGYEV